MTRMARRSKKRDSFSEVADAIELIDGVRSKIARNQRRIDSFRGTYEAEWLLSDWGDAIWITRYGPATRQVDGVWKKALKIDWSIRLPNGKLLTEPCYTKLLEVCRKAAFLYREGYPNGRGPAITTWHKFTRFLAILCKWLVIDGEIYQVERYGLRLLEQTAIDRMHKSMGLGGAALALKLDERIVDALYFQALGSHCPEKLLNSPGRLPKIVVSKIIEWLKNNNGYNRDNGVSRALLATLIHEQSENLGHSEYLGAIIRQFEPALQNSEGLLVSFEDMVEYPGHRTVSIDDALDRGVTKSQVKMLARSFKVLFSLHRQLPDLLPDPNIFKIDDSLAKAESYCRDHRHTPFMPIDTGVQYLNEAIRWVHCYGDDFVDYYLQCCSIYNKTDNIPLQSIPGAISLIAVPESLREIGLMTNCFNMRWRGFSEFRINPTISDALEVWVGALVVLMGMLVPIRESEIINLRRDALLGDGPYWLNSETAKHTVRDKRASSGGKPIPTIVARAIKQLQRFGDGLCDIYEEKDAYLQARLFYLPIKFCRGTPKDIGEHQLSFYLDRFCDFVGLELDPLGRRWYIRVHEMRKWFLLLLFWSGRFDVIDAASQIAGHCSIQQTYMYFEREFPAAEFAALECEYAIDRLRRFDQAGVGASGEIGISDLYERVLTHFKADQLELVAERDWIDYVSTLHAEGGFKLYPYSIEIGGDRRHCVAFLSADEGEGHG